MLFAHPDIEKIGYEKLMAVF